MRHPSRQAGRRLAGLFWLCLLLLARDPSAGAQGQAPRARIGLALGGGSARGFTHIGVLQWFHEHRIPIDVIGGTSMGALVGGGMATGMLPGEIEALVRSTDWARMLAPAPPFQDKTFRRKEDSRAFPSLIEFGLKHGISLPSALSPGQQASLFLSHVALPYYALDRFADLPIPFACVAVDLQTSEAVVLDSGALEEALRASMSIPGVFTPMRIGDRVLVDGGLLNNVPADVVKGMGADVVIAVDVGRDLSTRKRSDSIFRVLVEALDVVMRTGARKALASADIVIQPDLKGLVGSEFGRVSEFLRQGYQAAEAHRDRLLPFALGEEEYRAHIEARMARRRSAIPTPASLTVDGVTGAQASVIRRRLQHHVGHPLDRARLERDITLLTGSDRYDSITYRVTTTDGRPNLRVTAREHPNAPPYLRGALDISNVEASSVTAALRGRLTFFDVVTPGSELRLDAGVGRPSRAAAEWYLALGNHGLFVAPRASYLRDQQGFMLDGRVVAEYRFDTYEAAADAGLSLGHDFELRAGYARERVSSQLRVGDPILPEFTGAQSYWRARAVFDGQSNPVVPDHGLYLRGELRRFTETAKVADPEVLVSFREPDQLTIGEVRASYFKSAGRRGRLFAAGGGGWTFRDHTILNAFSLGGPLELSALQQNELRGSNYVLANAGYLHEVARLLEGAAGRLYVGGWVENGTVFEHVDDAQVRTNFSAGLIMETIIGPAFFVGSLGTDGRSRVYVGLGQVFRH